MTLVNHHQVESGGSDRPELLPPGAMRRMADGLTRCSVRTRIPVPLVAGREDCEFITFHGLSDGREHVCVAFGDWEKSTAPLVRIHSECLTGDLFGSLRCDCGPQLQEALELLGAEAGLLLYMRQEGRGIGLYNKLDAYSLQQKGLDTFEANTALGFGEDERNYLPAAQMLKCLDINAITLLTNNPDKVSQMERCGIEVKGVRRTGSFVNPHNAAYIAAKRVCSQHAHPEL